MHVLVTGVAGFIASHLAEALVGEGHRVRGVDCFTPTYPERRKRDNLADLLPGDGDFEFIEADLRSADLDEMLDGVDVVAHHAAIPGVRASWSAGFRDYLEHNVFVTHRLLEAARRVPPSRFLYASSSSVYGNALRYPSSEEDVPRPHSPYGVTKLGAEQLCLAYAANFGLPTVCLRYFSVYGPRQRPDMGVHRIIDAALGHGTFSVFGSGAQIRDMTFVGDVVAANLAALNANLPPGVVANVAGGSEVSLNEVIDTVSELIGEPVPVTRTTSQPGDVFRTGGSTSLARELLGWAPQVPLREGLDAQIRWQRP